MSLSVALDIAIGLVVTFAVVSLAATAIAEFLSQQTGLRGWLLARAVDELLGRSKAAREACYQTRAIAPLWNQLEPADRVLGVFRWYVRKGFGHDTFDDGKKRRLPSAIPPTSFADAVIEMIRAPVNELDTADAVLPDRLCYPPATCPIALVPVEMRTELARIAANGDAALRAHLVARFNDKMERVSGTFQREIKVLIFGVGLVIALCGNLGTISLANRLAASPAARQAAVEFATKAYGEFGTSMEATQRKFEAAREKVVETSTTSRPDEAESKPAAQASLDAAEKSRSADEARQVAAIRDSTKSLIATFGRESPWADVQAAGGWVAWTLGLLVTAGATTVGAGFWFDLLGKLLRGRTAANEKEGAKEGEKGQATTGTTTGASAPSARPNQGRAAMVPEPATGALTTGMVGFDPTATEHDPFNARWLAELSILAYQRQRAALGDSLRGLGFSEAHVLEKGSHQGFVAASERVIVLAFRGTEADETERYADIWTDAKHTLVDPAWPTKAQGGAPVELMKRLVELRAHQGFSEALAALWPEVSAKLEEARARFPNATLWCTGHSLGGALAMLAAVQLALWEGRELAGVYTFGQPRVFEQSVAKDITERLGARVFRYVNHMDPVPSVPLTWSQLTAGGSFGHVADARLFDAAGNVTTTQSMWIRFLDLWSDPKAANAGNQLRARVKDALGHHGSARYRDLLKRLCGET